MTIVRHTLSSWVWSDCPTTDEELDLSVTRTRMDIEDEADHRCLTVLELGYLSCNCVILSANEGGE